MMRGAAWRCWASCHTSRHSPDAAAQLRRLDDERPFVHLFVHFPLSKQGDGWNAALLAQCAAVKGTFQPMHDVLFDRPDLLKAANLEELAQHAGMEDLQALDECIKAKATEDAVNSHSQAAASIGVRSTPSFIIRGELYPGLLEPNAFEAAIFGGPAR